MTARPTPAKAAALLIAVMTLILGLSLGFAAQPVAAAETGDPVAAEVVEARDTTLSGLWARTVIYVRNQQRDLHRELAGAIKALRRDGSATAAWSLIVLSFLYGVFHAAGPGHGKAVISTYLLTHRSALSRGIWLSAVAALTQGLTAILLVLVLVALIGWKRSDAQAAVGTLETVSFALIALLGLGLAARALWSFGRGITTRRAAVEASEASEGCGHSHAPGLEQLSRPLSLKTFAAVVLSIGIRPCSGAVLVLLFAEVLGLRWAGIAAVLAMSLGTAATVGVLAVLAVNFRRLAAMVAGGAGGGRHFALAGQAVALLGGVLITALGASLFFGSLGAQHPLL
ncbi:MAG: nickel/cobalt transporter [Kiloniellales bacterium]|nr:nickel/cobalt transporter [Kiloniellales bacterium]